uniref:Uncharacterized protein n=1 Tax=Rhizophora mucronata TaxID=61149 RepID=A0A2P2MYI8_RHIMU
MSFIQRFYVKTLRVLMISLSPVSFLLALKFNIAFVFFWKASRLMPSPDH